MSWLYAFGWWVTHIRIFLGASLHKDGLENRVYTTEGSCFIDFDNTSRDADKHHCLVVMKIMSAQMDRDDRIHKLFATMNSFYDIVSDLEKRPEMRHTLQDLLQRIAQQTIECFYFIRDYAKTKGFGECDLTSDAILLPNTLLTSKTNRTAVILHDECQDRHILYCVCQVQGGVLRQSGRSDLEHRE